MDRGRMDEERAGDLARLLRWEDAGGTWQLAGRRTDEVTVALCRCDGGEEVDRLVSSDAELIRYVLDEC